MAFAAFLVDATTAFDTKLVALGGYSPDANTTFNVDIISVSSNAHTQGADMPSPLQRFGSAIANDTIYVVGGSPGNSNDQTVFTNATLAYDISTSTWTKLDDFPLPVAANPLVLVNNTLYVLGGVSTRSSIRQPAKYNLDESKWIELPTPLPVDIIDLCAVVGIKFNFPNARSRKLCGSTEREQDFVDWRCGDCG